MTAPARQRHPPRRPGAIETGSPQRSDTNGTTPCPHSSMRPVRAGGSGKPRSDRRKEPDAEQRMILEDTPCKHELTSADNLAAGPSGGYLGSDAARQPTAIAAKQSGSLYRLFRSPPVYFSGGVHRSRAVLGAALGRDLGDHWTAQEPVRRRIILLGVLPWTHWIDCRYRQTARAPSSAARPVRDEMHTL